MKKAYLDIPGEHKNIIAIIQPGLLLLDKRYNKVDSINPFSILIVEEETGEIFSVPKDFVTDMYEEDELQKDAVECKEKVEQFSILMKDRLDIKRNKGRYGWYDKSVISNEELAKKFMYSLYGKDNINMVDVANYAMMLHYRNVPSHIIQKLLPLRDP